jgi:hypothetical protein
MSYGGLAMSPAWRTVLLAGLAALLLAPVGKRLAMGAGIPHQIGAGLDTMVLVPAGHFIRGSTWEEVDEAHRMAMKSYAKADRE